MFHKFSQPALRVVFWARSEAGRLGSEVIGPEHLLLGFLAEDRGESGRAQAMAGLFAGTPCTLEQEVPPHEPFFSSERALRLRQSLTETANAGARQPDNVDMPLAEYAQRALMAAHEHAGSSSVGMLDILWALVNETQNGVSHVLRLNDVTPEQVEDTLRKG